MTTRYQVLVADSPRALSKCVTRALQSGWRLRGDLAVVVTLAGVLYIQVMVQ